MFGLLLTFYILPSYMSLRKALWGLESFLLIINMFLKMDSYK